MTLLRTALVLLTLLLPLAVRAEMPAPRDIYVNDFAGVLAAEDIAELTATLQALRETPGVEVTIVTIRNRAELGPWADLAGAAKALFNQWGIGHASRNDGVLILLATGEREVRVALGTGYPPVWDGRAHRVIEAFMLPRFAEGDFAGGLKAGLHGLEDYLIRPFAEGQSYEESREPPRVWGGTGWVDLAVFLGFLLLAGGLMLWEGRARLGDMLAARRACPKCGQRAIIVEQAAGTADAPGMVRRVCRSCGWHLDRVIPAAVAVAGEGDPQQSEHGAQSDSGSGGFGGGGSSGGGASGSW